MRLGVPCTRAPWSPWPLSLPKWKLCSGRTESVKNAHNALLLVRMCSECPRGCSTATTRQNDREWHQYLRHARSTITPVQKIFRKRGVFEVHSPGALHIFFFIKCCIAIMAGSGERDDEAAAAAAATSRALACLRLPPLPPPAGPGPRRQESAAPDSREGTERGRENSDCDCHPVNDQII